jgi:hypothetical protein
MTEEPTVRIIRKGKVDAEPFLKWYEVQKRMAKATWCIKTENFTYGSGIRFGGVGRSRWSQNSFTGVFDRERWCTKCRITLAEYENINRALLRLRAGENVSIAETIVDQVMTALGRPDLFLILYPFVDDGGLLQDCA